MDKQRRRLLHLGLLYGGVSLLGGRAFAQAGRFTEDADPEPYRLVADKLRDLFEKKRPPGPGDWLASHQETGQSFAEYVQANPNRPTSLRACLYLQPLGGFDAAQEKVLVKLQEFMRLIFGLEVRRLTTLDLAIIPAAARRMNPGTDQPQILTTHVLQQVLKPRRPHDAVAVLALTQSDLWAGPEWNYVFGQASLGARVGVWSTARLGDPVKDAGVFLRRMLQVAIHETGHMFGIKHCLAYQCCMNGSNSLDENDRTPLVYCPECDAKLGWACKLEPATRARALAKFAADNPLEKEAELWQKIAARL